MTQSVNPFAPDEQVKRDEEQTEFKADVDSPDARADNPDADETVDQDDLERSPEEPQVSQFDSPKMGQDLGNHEADEVVDPPTLNDKGELVDSEGKKVFTTVEESLKDGSFLLDGQGRMPGVYLQDLEHEARLRNGARIEQAFENAKNTDQKVTSRTVSVNSSPVPDVTVTSGGDNPMTSEDLAPAALRAAPDMPASEEQITRNT